MIKFTEFLELIDYKISNGFEETMACFSDNVRSLSYENDDQSVSLSIEYDPSTQEVFSVTAANVTEWYVYLNPLYQEDYHRSVDVLGEPTYIYDEDEFIRHAIRIFNEDLETIDLELDAEDVFRLMQEAHAQNITLNQLVENILREKLTQN